MDGRVSSNEGKDTVETMEDVKRRNVEAGQHFFDEETMRFFDSRIETELIGQFFVTSECGPNDIRAFTVRRPEDNGSIATVGEFQGHATLFDAVHAIMEEAKA